MRDQSRMLAPLRGRIYNMVARAVLHMVANAPGIQAVQIELQEGEVRSNAEHFFDFGFSSTPLPGAEAIAVFPGGSRDHVLVVKIDDRRYRFKANAGGSALYDANGSVVHMKNDGTVEVIAATRVDITCPLVRMTGDLEVEGDITDRYLTDNTSNHSLRQTYNVHTHPENDNGGPTSAPNQQLPT